MQALPVLPVRLVKWRREGPGSTSERARLCSLTNQVGMPQAQDGHKTLQAAVAARPPLGWHMPSALMRFIVSERDPRGQCILNVPGTDVTFLWTAQAECTIAVGLDGQLQPVQASLGSISLNGQAGNHALRLEVSDCPQGDIGQFQFLGVSINTGVPGGYVLCTGPHTSSRWRVHD